MPMKPETTCINCGADITGNFCSACGQKAETTRITLRTLWADFQSRWLGFDNRFLRTVSDLFRSPGKVGRVVVGGNRVRYVGPVGYLFVMLTIYLVLFNLLGISWEEFLKSSQLVENENTENFNEASAGIQEVIFDYFRSFSFLQAPFYALWAMLFFRKKGMNFLEHMVNVFYTQGQLIWFSLVNITLFRFTGNNLAFYGLMLYSVYYGWSCAQFYAVKTIWKGIARGILVFVFGFLTFTLTFAIIMVIFLARSGQLPTPAGG